MDPLTPSDGMGVLHLFFRVGEATPEGFVEVCTSAGVDTVLTVAVLGHKADLAVMALDPDWVALRTLQRDLEGVGLEAVWSYVSLTEVSEYADGLPERMKEMRLRPRLPPPNKRAWCFYPMSKRRGHPHNWYSLPFEERRELMEGHGRTGRTFAGRILQLVTGSTGLDDWEWGVTLFADRPDDLKDVVYTMRFDEASARYGEFGPFFAGILGGPGEVAGLVWGSGGEPSAGGTNLRR